ncbi:uncharacterized protein BYT42DRAFT_583815 [Radiomyces spectabilis]|uniref:uncharacterized protein n=1 Tax=Radiomyces spectabilis TaxID=64574 RepID=UPI00222115FC|nr:uncharacterized protein BYT42DRAFT_583815 [Radiomyces spectabilis]KAI8369291.1 hypothetical protein BYT42DRAFT_583815 [Radiomyces spectabilis]
MSTKRATSSRLSAVTSRTDHSESPTNGSRQRQSKRDEAIRKKLEQELSKKRPGSTRIRQTRKIAGTVSALRPAQALTVKENMLVIEAAQLMAAKRSDCVLVVDEDEHLSGIFTAKDLAYRMVAESLDARNTMVRHIMTKGPMCVTADTSATDALNLMVSRGFRHLPVCNEEGDIFGLLDITKCLYEALDKMERAFGSSRKLYDALEGVEKEWSGSSVQLAQYMEALRERMSCPDINSVLDGSSPAEVNLKTNVRDVARLMKEYHTTAVLVTDREGLAGIFTTKDVVLRVIAAGLNPENCSVVRVMTPHPDTATPQTTIMEALRRMHDGHYLNLPIIENGTILGVVDVLKLTYATLEQISSIQGNDGEGPMWGRFWDSFGAAEQGEEESLASDPLSSLQPSTNAISPEPSASFSQLQDYSEITPNESASMVNHEESHSEVTSAKPKESTEFAFKFTSMGGKTHRFAAPAGNYEQLLDIVRHKVLAEHLAFTGTADDGSNEWLSISYLDDEDDEVLMSSDADIRDAVQLARKMGRDRVKLFVHDSAAIKEQPPSTPIPSPTPAEFTEKPTATEEEVKETKPLEKEEPKEEQPQSPQPQHTREMPSSDANDASSVLGLPKDMLLPASIAFLGVVIAGVFIASRISSSSR